MNLFGILNPIAQKSHKQSATANTNVGSFSYTDQAQIARQSFTDAKWGVKTPSNICSHNMSFV
jgi:hypothetical protein